MNQQEVSDLMFSRFRATGLLFHLLRTFGIKSTYGKLARSNPPMYEDQSPAMGAFVYRQLKREGLWEEIKKLDSSTQDTK